MVVHMTKIGNRQVRTWLTQPASGDREIALELHHDLDQMAYLTPSQARGLIGVIQSALDEWERSA